MKASIARFLVRLYPTAWRERYGEEFEALLETADDGFGSRLNVIRTALFERFFPTLGVHMQNSFGTIARQPSALAPVAMSLAALGVVGVAYMISISTGHGGLVRQQDEGAAAHLWQILMAGQIPVLLYFAIKWLPRAPKQTLRVLALQAGAAVAAAMPVFLLHL